LLGLEIFNVFALDQQAASDLVELLEDGLRVQFFREFMGHPQ
jgi:hypothetical protein